MKLKLNLPKTVPSLLAHSVKLSVSDRDELLSVSVREVEESEVLEGCRFVEVEVDGGDFEDNLHLVSDGGTRNRSTLQPRKVDVD